MVRQTCPEMTPDKRFVRGHTERMAETLTLTAVFTPDENGWTMAQLAEWPAVVTSGRTVELFQSGSFRAEDTTNLGISFNLCANSPLRDGHRAARNS